MKAVKIEICLEKLKSTVIERGSKASKFFMTLSNVIKLEKAQVFVHKILFENHGD